MKYVTKKILKKKLKKLNDLRHSGSESEVTYRFGRTKQLKELISECK